MQSTSSPGIVKNSFYGFLSYAVPLVFTIVLTPVIIRNLGVEKYGLFVLASTITGFFSLLRFGMGYGVAKAVSEYYGNQRPAGVGEVIGSTITILGVVGIVGFVLTSLIGFWGLDFLNIPLVYHPQARLVFFLSGLVFIFSGIESALANVLAGAQRLDSQAKIYLSVMSGSNAVMIILVLLGFDVASLVVVQLTASIVTLSGYYIVSRRLLRDISLRLTFSWRYFKPFLKFNIFVYLHEAASAFLFQADKLIISIFSGPAAVSYYNIAGTVSQKIQGTGTSLTAIFFPVASAMAATERYFELGNIYRRVMRTIFLVAGGLAVTLATFGEPLLLHWVGQEFVDKGLIALYILTITHFLLAVYAAVSYFIIGLGRVKYVAGCTSLFVVLNMVFLLILFPRYGIVGAAWAYMLSLLPLPFFLRLAERKFFGLTGAARFYSAELAKVAVTGAVFYILLGFFIAPFATNLFRVIVFGALSFGVYIGIYKLFGFLRSEDWQIFVNFVNSLPNVFRIR